MVFAVSYVISTGPVLVVPSKNTPYQTSQVGALNRVECKFKLVYFESKLLMKFENLYTSVGCNTSCSCVDWNSSGLIAYGACNCIVVLDLKATDASEFYRTLVKHSATVKTVKWVVKDHALLENEIISGGDDCRAIIWNLLHPNESIMLIGHTGSINTVDSIHFSTQLLVATGSSDNSIKLWKVTSDTSESFQNISLTCGCLVNRFALISEVCTLLAFSTSDSNIHIYANDLENQLNFSPLFKLGGHQNWVRGLEFVSFRSTYYLASCGQDKKIRIWKFCVQKKTRNQDDLDFFRFEDCDSILNEARKFSKKQWSLNVTLESILFGHDDWVFDIHWNQSLNGLQLLSSSLDKTMIIWSLNGKDIWYQNIQVGMVGEISSGFYGGKFSIDGQSILGYGFNGNLFLWNKAEKWQPINLAKGHNASVKGISWGAQGRNLFSTSADQTTLLHSDCRIDSQLPKWKVIACPQKHGFEIQCIATINFNTFATGADEKVIRVFQEPHKDNIKNRLQPLIPSEQEMCKVSSHPLNLSNKVMCSNMFQAVQGRNIIGNTLWPEIQKLYGHAHEIFALTCSADGKVLASSCKAHSTKDSQIVLWNTCSWKIIKTFNVHQLTVTCLEFSPSCQFLLAVSKDRKWSLFKRALTSGEVDYELAAEIENILPHRRMIWCCCWSHDDMYFATTSRDGKIVLWEVGPNVQPYIANLNEVRRESITACAFACNFFDRETYLIAAGMESGVIRLYTYDSQITEVLSLDQNHAHHLPVRQLKFRPNYQAFQLASCSDDHIVRIYDFTK